MKLWQLSLDTEVYGDHAGWWVVTTDDQEDEIAGPFETSAEAVRWILDHGGEA
jgi:hypothetical protein